jgi:hypothetical protein
MGVRGCVGNELSTLVAPTACAAVPCNLLNQIVFGPMRGRSRQTPRGVLGMTRRIVRGGVWHNQKLNEADICVWA